jgi:hypothetical protein
MDIKWPKLPIGVVGPLRYLPDRSGLPNADRHQYPVGFANGGTGQNRVCADRCQWVVMLIKPFPHPVDTIGTQIAGKNG